MTYPSISRTLAIAVFAMGLSVAAMPVAADTLDTVKAAGTIRVGYANEAPIGFTTVDGALTGEAPEIAKVVLAKLGVTKIEPVLLEWGALIPSLSAGRVDMLAAGMYVTPARCEQVLFSEPTYTAGEALVVLQGNPKKLSDYQSILANKDVVLGLLAGGYELQYLKDMGVPDAQLKQFPDTPTMLAALQSSRVDAITNPAPTSAWMAKNSPGVEMLPQFFSAGKQAMIGSGAFAFRKDDAALRDAFNAELAAFIGKPEHLETIEPFGYTADFLPKQTTKELCAK